MNEKRKELIEEICRWQDKIRADDDHLEMAFFKIFVKFEKFLTDAIMKYATGEYENHEKVKRRLEFVNSEHLLKTIRLDYLDTGNTTRRLVDQLFHSDNRISFFFNSEHIEFYEKMKALRNYIAHESEESERVYLKKTLGNHNYMSPNEFLKHKNKGSSNSQYSKFIEIVKIYSEDIDMYSDID